MRLPPKYIVLPDPDCAGRWLLNWLDSDRAHWAEILTAVKALPGRLYNPSLKSWSIPKTEAAIAAAVEIGFEFPTSVAPSEEIAPAAPSGPTPAQELRAAVSRVNLDPSRWLVPGMYPHQLEFLRFMEYSSGVGACGDEMGTGKTLSALGWIAYAQDFPALIVVNATTKGQWLRAWHQWYKECPHKDVRRVVVLEGRRPQTIPKGVSCIINWDILADWAGTLQLNNHFHPDGPLGRAEFKIMVGDEVQAIGNPTSLRSKAFRALAKTIPHFIGMSGTPIRSKTKQFWPLLNIMAPRAFPNYNKFLFRYCAPKSNGFGMTFDGATNIEELHALSAPYLLRRLKSEVMKDLPPKMREVIPLAIKDTAMRDYRAEESVVFGRDMSRAERRERVAGLLRSAYALKEQAALDWLHGFLEDCDSKVLIFAWHRDVVDLVADSLRTYNPVKIYGGIDGAKRDGAVVKFQTDPKCRAMVANIQAGGVGLDGLQKVCSHCVTLEFSYTPTDHAQAEDRLHRGGQGTPVNSYYLVAPDTVDMDAIEVLDLRAQQIAGVLDGNSVADSDLLTAIMARRGY